jgi:hypothetical protein
VGHRCVRINGVWYERPAARSAAAHRLALASRHHLRDAGAACAFKLPDTTSLQGIHTVAGGYLAFRYVCGAQLTGFDPHALPPGAMIPGTIRYVSHLTDEGRRHEVTVRIAPLMILVQVE